METHVANAVPNAVRLTAWMARILAIFHAGPMSGHTLIEEGYTPQTSTPRATDPGDRGRSRAPPPHRLLKRRSVWPRR